MNIGWNETKPAYVVRFPHLHNNWGGVALGVVMQG